MSGMIGEEGDGISCQFAGLDPLEGWSFMSADLSLFMVVCEPPDVAKHSIRALRPLGVLLLRGRGVSALLRKKKTSMNR